MGLNNENASRLVFDIETAPLPDATEYLEPAEAPANYKDPAKIAAYIAEKQQEQLERAGLDVDLCGIVAIAWQKEGDGAVTALTRQDCDEDGLINQFWTQLMERYHIHQDKFIGPHILGFNCLAFDLPVLMRRSQYLGIPVPSLQIDKFKHPQVTDLAQVLSFNGAVRMRSLAFYAKRFGVAVSDPLTGAMMAQAVAESRWEAIKAHVSADVQQTAALAAKLRLFQVPEPVL